MVSLGRNAGSELKVVVQELRVAEALEFHSVEMPGLNQE